MYTSERYSSSTLAHKAETAHPCACTCLLACRRASARISCAFACPCARALVCACMRVCLTVRSRVVCAVTGLSGHAVRSALRTHELSSYRCRSIQLHEQNEQYHYTAEMYRGCFQSGPFPGAAVARRVRSLHARRTVVCMCVGQTHRHLMQAPVCVHVHA